MTYVLHTDGGSHAAALAARRYSSLQVLDGELSAKQGRQSKPSKEASIRPETTHTLL